MSEDNQNVPEPSEAEAWKLMMDSMIKFISASTKLMNTINEKAERARAAGLIAEPQPAEPQPAEPAEGEAEPTEAAEGAEDMPEVVICDEDEEGAPEEEAPPPEEPPAEEPAAPRCPATCAGMRASAAEEPPAAPEEAPPEDAPPEEAPPEEAPPEDAPPAEEPAEEAPPADAEAPAEEAPRKSSAGGECLEECIVCKDKTGNECGLCTQGDQEATENELSKLCVCREVRAIQDEAIKAGVQIEGRNYFPAAKAAKTEEVQKPEETEEAEQPEQSEEDQTAEGAAETEETENVEDVEQATEEETPEEAEETKEGEVLEEPEKTEKEEDKAGCRGSCTGIKRTDVSDATTETEIKEETPELPSEVDTEEPTTTEEAEKGEEDEVMEATEEAEKTAEAEETGEAEEAQEAEDAAPAEVEATEETEAAAETEATVEAEESAEPENTEEAETEEAEKADETEEVEKTEAADETEGVEETTEEEVVEEPAAEVSEDAEEPREKTCPSSCPAIAAANALATNEAGLPDGENVAEDVCVPECVVCKDKSGIDCGICAQDGEESIQNDIGDTCVCKEVKSLKEQARTAGVDDENKLSVPDESATDDGPCEIECVICNDKSGIECSVCAGEMAENEKTSLCVCKEVKTLKEEAIKAGIQNVKIKSAVVSKQYEVCPPECIICKDKSGIDCGICAPGGITIEGSENEKSSLCVCIELKAIKEEAVKVGINVDIRSSPAGITDVLCEVCVPECFVCKDKSGKDCSKCNPSGAIEETDNESSNLCVCEEIRALKQEAFKAGIKVDIKPAVPKQPDVVTEVGVCLPECFVCKDKSGVECGVCAAEPTENEKSSLCVCKEVKIIKEAAKKFGIE